MRYGSVTVSVLGLGDGMQNDEELGVPTLGLGAGNFVGVKTLNARGGRPSPQQEKHRHGQCPRGTDVLVDLASNTCRATGDGDGATAAGALEGGHTKEKRQDGEDLGEEIQIGGDDDLGGEVDGHGSR